MSNRARKRYAREARVAANVLQISNVEKRLKPAPEIQFTEQDLAGLHCPHSDALVITLKVANFEIRRVLVDTGSSVNILFHEPLKQMGMDHDNVKPTTTVMAAFDGNLSTPLGRIDLPTTVGEGEGQKTTISEYMVLNMKSPYNVIIGRPWLHQIGAVTSTLYQCLKYVHNQNVHSVRGCQPTSRKCHAIALKEKAPK